MEAVIGLLLVILRVSHGVETYCDGRLDEAQCYGALGGTVVLKLMDRAPEQFKLSKYVEVDLDIDVEILHWVDNAMITNLIENRSSFTPSNGTFRINNLSRSDGDNYLLALYDSDGQITELRILQLTIQAPVSSVSMVSECLSQGELRVSCSSEGGDSPQYSWTLDGQTLTDTQLLSGNTESNNITLRQDVSGRLVCSVRNNVNEVWREERISTCGFIFIDCISNGTHTSQWVFEANNTLCIPTTTARIFDHSLLILGLRAAVVIVIFTGIVLYFIWKKKKYKTAEEKLKHQENSVMMVEMRNSASEL